MIKFKLENSSINEMELKDYEMKVQEIHQMIHNKTGLGNYFLGWVDLPKNYDKNEIKRMKDKAYSLRKYIKILLVIGIGGSYLGARAAIEMINGLYNNDNIEIIYVGNTMSSTYTKQIIDYVKGKIFGICVISKSGTTIEPAIAFNLFKELLIKECGKENAQKRIVVITDKSHGVLNKLATKEGYEKFIIPDDIGGRFSVLTPVGIFVILMANINVDDIFAGAQLAYKDTLEGNLKNEAYRYALTRYILHTKYNYCSEMIIGYEIQLQMIFEWWKQLFGESEGKNNKGLLPTSCIFSTDLHSLGQFIQDGSKNVLFETIIKINKPQMDLTLQKNENNDDGLNYLAGKTLHEVNNIALEGVLEAHTKTAKIPNIILELSQMDSKMFGYLSYWFMKACAMSAYLLEINPFDQPGVEVYKKNMFKLLGKK